jgi:hypothetical protein
MKFAIISNTTGMIVREFEAPDSYVAPTHKFGTDRSERIVRVVETKPPELEAGQELQREDKLTDTELRREWLTVQQIIPTPSAISLRQFRMALKRVGLFSKIDELKNSPYLNQTQKDDLTEFLEYSNTIERNHPLIQAFAPMLGVTSEQIDQVFQLADTL